MKKYMEEFWLKRRRTCRHYIYLDPDSPITPSHLLGCAYLSPLPCRDSDLQKAEPPSPQFTLLASILPFSALP